MMTLREVELVHRGLLEQLKKPKPRVRRSLLKRLATAIDFSEQASRTSSLYAAKHEGAEEALLSALREDRPVVLLLRSFGIQLQRSTHMHATDWLQVESVAHGDGATGSFEARRPYPLLLGLAEGLQNRTTAIALAIPQGLDISGFPLLHVPQDEWREIVDLLLVRADRIIALVAGSSPGMHAELARILALGREGDSHLVNAQPADFDFVGNDEPPSGERLDDPLLPRFPNAYEEETLVNDMPGFIDSVLSGVPS